MGPSAPSHLRENHPPEHLLIATEYFAVQDDPDNHGPEIREFLASVGLPEGNPYCAAFVSWCLTQAGVQKPEVRSGLASHFILEESIDAKDVMYGRETIPAGSVIIWRRGNTIFGHAGFVLLPWQGARGVTIEGNTQINGVEGIWIKQRTISPANYFRITHFTPVSP